jgi:hypothetical protein
MKKTLQNNNNKFLSKTSLNTETGKAGFIRFFLLFRSGSSSSIISSRIYFFYAISIQINYIFKTNIYIK